MTATPQSCYKNGNIYHLNDYGLWVFWRRTPKPPANINLPKVDDKYFVYYNGGNIWSNSKYWIRLVTHDVMKSYTKMKNLDGSPVILDKWCISRDGGDLFIIVTKKVGV